MKLAFAGKGGVGKTTLTAWTADYLARQGKNVWMVDADTALSLGQASGLAQDKLPEPLVLREDVIRERIGSGIYSLTPEVSDLPATIAVDVPLSDCDRCAQPGAKKLLLMGTVTGAGGGCACKANSLLKAVLVHLVLDQDDWVLVDLEAGVEHLGRGTVAGVDGLIIVSEPSKRSLDTGAAISAMAGELGLSNQLLVLNRFDSNEIPKIERLPEKCLAMPTITDLMNTQLHSGTVTGLNVQADIDTLLEDMLLQLTGPSKQKQVSKMSGE